MKKDKTKSKSVDLIGYSIALWSARLRVVKVALIAAVLGVIIALLSENLYTASSVFIPQVANSGGVPGNLGGLASLAGIDLGSTTGGSEFPPSLYPKILNNIHFKMNLLDAPITVPGTTEKVTYQEYFENHYQPSKLSLVKAWTVGLPFKLIGLVRGGDKTAPMQNLNSGDTIQFIKPNQDQLDHFSRLADQVSIISNLKDGFVTISVTMPDPYAAAEMTAYVEILLEKALTDYKIDNARERLKYVTDRFNEKRAEFLKADQDLAEFKDSNKNPNTASAQTKLTRLQSEYDLIFSVYMNLAKELEQTKIQVNKSTPTISIIQPVTVPTLKSSTSRALIVIMFTLLGGLMIPIKIYFQLYIIPQIKEKQGQNGVI